jgi:hypothetical protein
MMKNTLKRDSDKVKNLEDYQATRPQQLELFRLYGEDHKEHSPVMTGER